MDRTVGHYRCEGCGLEWTPTRADGRRNGQRCPRCGGLLVRATATVEPAAGAARARPDEHAPLTAAEIAMIRERAERAYHLHAADHADWGRDYPDVGHDYVTDVDALLATLDIYREIVRAVAAGPLATTHGDLACVFCERWIGPGQSHAPDCPVTVARALLGDTP